MNKFSSPFFLVTREKERLLIGLIFKTLFFVLILLALINLGPF